MSTTDTPKEEQESLNTQEQVYAAPEAELNDESNQINPLDNLASRGIRLGSYILDSLIFMVGAFGPGIILMYLTGAFNDYDMKEETAMWSLYAYSGIFILIVIGVNCYLLYKNGQTMAKKLLNIKIVRTDNSHANFGRVFWLRAFLVNIVYQIPIVGGIFFLLDVLFIYRSDQRCLHDLIADTKVINV